MKVAFVDLSLEYEQIRDELLNTFDLVCKKSAYILGDELSLFEDSIAKLCNTKFAIGVANGGDAITLCLKAFGITNKDEVIIPANSFLATMTCVVASGAKPIFVDVLKDGNMNPSLLEDAITKNTKAIIPVHISGKPAKMDEINEIAKKHSLYVIEDAAQSIGATYKGKPTGSLSNAGCFSLHPLKNLALMGDGGIITTNDEGLNNTLKLMRNYGLKNRDEAVIWGVNSRLDNMQAGFGLVKLKYLKQWNTRYKEIANQYYEKLHSFIECPSMDEGFDSVFHNFIIQHDKRDELMQYLEDKEIQTKIHYPIPLHLQPVAKELNHKIGDFPMTETMSKRIISLPIYPFLTNDKIDFICENILKFVSNNDR